MCQSSRTPSFLPGRNRISLPRWSALRTADSPILDGFPRGPRLGGVAAFEYDGIGSIRRARSDVGKTLMIIHSLQMRRVSGHGMFRIIFVLCSSDRNAHLCDATTPQQRQKVWHDELGIGKAFLIVAFSLNDIGVVVSTRSAANALLARPCCGSNSNEWAKNISCCTIRQAIDAAAVRPDCHSPGSSKHPPITM